MKQGEIWLINLDPTVGAEIKKTRPAIIGCNSNLCGDFKEVLKGDTFLIGSKYPELDDRLYLASPPLSTELHSFVNDALMSSFHRSTAYEYFLLIHRLIHGAPSLIKMSDGGATFTKSCSNLWPNTSLLPKCAQY